MKRFFIIVCLAFCVQATTWAKEYKLFSEGKSSYTIVLGPDASESEKWAAQELSRWICEMSGVQLPVTGLDGGRKGHRIVLGYNKLLARLVPESVRPEAEDESFTYLNAGGDICIWGGSARGTMYGVFSFLENEFECRWYTSRETRIHKFPEWSFSSLYDREEPGIAVRNDFFFDAFDPVWSARNKNNSVLAPSGDQEMDRLGGGVGYWGCHTMGRFVPVSTYFETHPEYFSELDGKRISERTQLCLSNPEVLQLCIEGVRKAYAEHPEYLIYDVSQNDWENPCQCEKCRAIKERYGNEESGIMLWFVNQVADALKDEMPDKYIGTFAYMYTRTPPKNIRPRDNVVVRLCSIECCFIHPFGECGQNDSFVSDLKAWGELAPHLYIWDYVTQFGQYYAPFPNFHVLQPNIQMFRDNHAIGVMEQGAYQEFGSCFGELKTYLISKLLWNPDCDVQAVINDFFWGYYGIAAPYVQEFFDLCQYQVRDDIHMNCFEGPYHPIYGDHFVREGIDIYKKAAAVIEGNEELTDRVERAFLPVFFLQGARNSEDGRETVDILKRIVERDRITRFAEWSFMESPQEFINRIEGYGK